MDQVFFYDLFVKRNDPKKIDEALSSVKKILLALQLCSLLNGFM